MTKHILRYLAVTLTLLTLAACGGGGGGGQGPAAAPTSARFKISLSGNLPDNTAISGAVLTLTLPANVSPAMVDGAMASGVVTPSGNFVDGTALPVYTPSTDTTAGTVLITLINTNPNGVLVGEMATVTLQLANGAAPTASVFSIDPVDVKVTDALYNPISGLHAVVSDLQLH